MSDRPRLLVLTSTFPRWRDDHEPPFVFELARRCKDFEVHVLAPHAPGAALRETINGVHVHRFRYAPARWERLAYDGGIPHHLATNPWLFLLVPIFLLAQMLSAIRLCHQHRISAIHAHWLLPQGLVAAIVKRLIRKRPRLVVTVHGADLYVLRNRFVDALRSWIASEADVITTVSRALHLDMTKFVNHDEKLVIASMGVDFNQLFVPGPPGSLRNNIVFAGRLVPKKGVKLLLGAFAQIAHLYPQLTLTIAGHGPLEHELKRRTEQLGLSHQVDFLGRYQLAQLPPIYRGAALAVFPFQMADDGDREGFGLVVAEAMGCGIPVIVGDVPAIGDLVEHEVSGLIVAPGDANALAKAITRILSEPALAKRLAETGRARAEYRYDWSVIANAYQELLHGRQTD